LDEQNVKMKNDNHKSEIRNVLGTVFYLAAAYVQCMFFASAAVFVMFQLIRGFFIDPGCVILHLALLAAQINVGVFSSWHLGNS